MDDLRHRFSDEEALLDAMQQERIVDLEVRLANCAWLLDKSRAILNRCEPRQLDQRPDREQNRGLRVRLI